MTDREIAAEIFHILEVDIVKRNIRQIDVINMQLRLKELIGMLSEGSFRDKILEKISMKSRFASYINDTGNIDFTGYGHHFW